MSLLALFLHSTCFLKGFCPENFRVENFVSEFFATIFWRVLCQWSRGSLTACFSRNLHRIPDGNHICRS